MNHRIVKLIIALSNYVKMLFVFTCRGGIRTKSQDTFQLTAQDAQVEFPR